MTCLRIAVSAGALLAAVAVSACDSAPQTPQQQANSQTLAACRQRANEVFDRQNRGAIYAPNSSANSPFSANFTPDNPSRGLSQQFAHDRLVNDCVRNTGTGSERSQPPAAPR